MIRAARHQGLVAPLGVLFTGVGLLGLASGHGPTICPFALGTGIACPGCGLTRGVAALLRGDVASSWRYHPLAALAVIEIAAAWTWWVWKRSGRTDRVPGTATRLILAATAVLLLGVWALRLMTGTLPPV